MLSVAVSAAGYGRNFASSLLAVKSSLGKNLPRLTHRSVLTIERGESASRSSTPVAHAALV